MTDDTPVKPLIVPDTSTEVVIPVTPTKGFLRSDIVQLILMANGCWLISFLAEYSLQIQEWLYLIFPDGWDTVVPKIMQTLGMLLAAYAAYRRSKKIDIDGQPPLKPENWHAANVEALNLGKKLRIANEVVAENKNRRPI